jgi:hypothetical protein
VILTIRSASVTTYNDSIEVSGIRIIVSHITSVTAVSESEDYVVVSIILESYVSSEPEASVTVVAI